jgi:thiamine monophosphate synthase
VTSLSPKQCEGGLYAVLDVDVAAARGWAPLDLARAFLAGGARLIQLRAKRMGSGPLVELTEQLVAALRQPISYLAVGPVFGTATKDTGYSPVGLDLVRRAALRAGTIPVVGIGGIDLRRAPDVLAAGAAAVAVISDLVTDDPAARVRAFLSTRT